MNDCDEMDDEKCDQHNSTLLEKTLSFLHPIVHVLTFIGCLLYSFLRKSNDRRFVGEVLLIVTAVRRCSASPNVIVVSYIASVLLL